MKTKKADWLATGTFILLAGIMGFLGISLPRTINIINHLDINSLYGVWASHFIICILFWFIIKKMDFRE